MTTLTSNDSSPNSPSTLASGTFALQIVQPGFEARELPLPIGKCTIGSSERCHVQLAGGTVRPLHCLIVQEGNEVLVTRWAPGALLNGQDFATAPFHRGDTLQIGDAQLELVAKENIPADANVQSETPSNNDVNSVAETPTTSTINSAFAATTALPQPAREFSNFKSTIQPTPPSAPQSPPNRADDIEVERLVHRLKSANSSARNRCRKLVGALRTVRDEVSGFDQRINELQNQLAVALEEREQIFTQLSQLQSDAGERESQSSEEIDRLISELTTAYEKASAAESAVVEQASQAEQMQEELVTLQTQRDEWEQVRSAGELQRNKLAQALADRERAIETLQAEVEQSREAADKADASRIDQTEAIATLQAELEVATTERDELASAQAQSQQYQQEIEQALADSEQNLAVFQLELEKFQLTSRQTEKETADNKAALEDLRVEFAQLTEERDKLIAKRTEYQLSEQGWEHELASRDVEIEKLTTEMESLRNELAESTQGVAEQVSQSEVFQQQLDALTAEREQLLAAAAEQVEKIRGWEESVAARDRRIKELEEEHDGICQVLQSVEEGAFEQVDFCNKLENQLASIREERDQLAAALPEQQEYIKQLEKALAERDGQITVLSDELNKTTARQGDFEAELSAGTSAYQALESELSDLNARYEQLVAAQSASDQNKVAIEQTLSEYQAQIEQLQQQIEATEHQRQELELVVAEGSQSKESSQSALNELQARYEQLSADYRTETERRQELDQQMVEHEQNIELFEVDLKSVRAELERTVEQVSSLQDERATLTLQLTGLREELAAQESGSESVDVDLQKQRDELLSELSMVREQLEQAQQDLAGSQPSDESTAMISQLQEENSQLQQNVEQQVEQVERLTADLEQARQSLQAAEQALLERSNTPVTSEEEATTEAPADSDYEATSYADELAAYDEQPQNLEDFHDAYAPEDNFEVADEYTAAAEVEASADEPASQASVFDESAPVSWDIPTEASEAANAELLPDATEPIESAEPFEVNEELTEVGQFSTPEEQVVDDAYGSQDDYAYETSEAVGTGEFVDSEPTDAELADADPVDDDLILEESTPAYQEMESVDELASDANTAEAAIEPEAVIPTTTAFDQPEADEENEQPVEEFKPPSFIDQYQHLLEEDGQADTEPLAPAPVEPAPAENRLGAELDAMDSGHDDDSDEALQAYMSNMLKRMRGDDNEESIPTPQASSGVVLNQKPDPVEAVSNVLENVAPASAVEAPENNEPLDLEKLKRSSQKPALPTDLAAMRELANSSARKAIAKHHKQRHLEKAGGLFFVCLVCICVGVYMLMAGVAAHEFTGLNFIGGSVAVLIGAGGGLKLLGLLLGAIRAGSWEKTAAKKIKTQASAAIEKAEAAEGANG